VPSAGRARRSAPASSAATAAGSLCRAATPRSGARARISQATAPSWAAVVSHAAATCPRDAARTCAARGAPAPPSLPPPTPAPSSALTSCGTSPLSVRRPSGAATTEAPGQPW